jgi:hypothetical protein
MAIPMDRFGKDHWSLLGYIESICVDACNTGIGEIDKRRLHCNPTSHPVHDANMMLYRGPMAWQPAWGTRLKGYFDFAERSDPAKAEAAGVQVGEHDDWDCLDDLEEAKLIEVLSLTNGFVQLTDLGMQVAAKVRQHKARGGQFATFSLTPAEAA